MFFLDIETLSTKASAVVLSIGVVHLKDDSPISYKEMVENNSIYIKLDAKYQAETLHRHIEKDTLDWWAKQAPAVRSKCFRPTDNDLSPERALTVLSTWCNERKQKGELCWIRGFMDAIVLEDLAKQICVTPIFKYNDYRDIRTAIDLIYSTSNRGYVDVDQTKCPGFSTADVMKHDPVHDSAYDAAMLLFGVTQ